MSEDPFFRVDKHLEDWEEEYNLVCQECGEMREVCECPLEDDERSYF